MMIYSVALSAATVSFTISCKPVSVSTANAFIGLEARSILPERRHLVQA
jgi:hypothetical protein